VPRLRQKWRIYAVLLAGLFMLTDIGITAAKAIWFAAAVVHPAERVVFDADYVQGLAKLGIVNVPGNKPSSVLIDARPTK
jgi:hypothetical protein